MLCGRNFLSVEGGGQFNLWRRHKETRGFCAGNWKSCRCVGAKFTLFCSCITHSSNPPLAVRLSNPPPVMKLAHLPPNLPQVPATQLDVALKRPNVPVYLSSHKQLLRSAKKGFFFFKSRLVASGCVRATQASVPNHPPRTHCTHTHLPRQHSSRQQLQQINLLLTVHLDWINLELGAITAIGSRGYSPNAGCYPALGIKRRSQRLLLSSPRQDRLDKVFSVLITGLSEAAIGFSL